MVAVLLLYHWGGLTGNSTHLHWVGMRNDIGQGSGSGLFTVTVTGTSTVTGTGTGTAMDVGMVMEVDIAKDVRTGASVIRNCEVGSVPNARKEDEAGALAETGSGLAWRARIDIWGPNPDLSQQSRLADCPPVRQASPPRRIEWFLLTNPTDSVSHDPHLPHSPGYQPPRWRLGARMTSRLQMKLPDTSGSPTIRLASITHRDQADPCSHQKARETGSGDWRARSAQKRSRSPATGIR
ncbi:hypothetical protein K493DRAFT_306427 [Basidiobolus meristosporus CBS 931.73]|uniref:Uncharacterized protein n=1 Tax=Basidiobolus meristosporus CBS 931.73 TaxID=1314790 RepID=A0A1Y1XSC3_9FUNG|nr:hypothetical protein K493DRAFT_306427 [Basidiobolus meristosporus CBS 931.73]|eukprot:ORX88657.1 hypothetical protein K493DRAFT_306427 [Basidiobolus meristosporus CBS 931.73]